MGLQRVVAADFFSCLEPTSRFSLGMPGFSMHVCRDVFLRSGGRLLELPANTIRLALHVTSAGLRIGSRCREMLVCQPSPKSATLKYIEYGKALPDESRLVPREHELTVGELHDAVVAFCASKCVQEDRVGVKGLFGMRIARQSCEVVLEVKLMDTDPIVKQRRTTLAAEQ